MKKYILTILTAVLLLIIQMTNAQTINFQLTITNASSNITCDGEMNIVCTGSSEPLNYIWYNINWDTIGTGSNITGLCTYDYYYVYIYNTHCQHYSLGGTVDDSTISGPVFQISSSATYTNNFLLSSVQIQQVTGGLAPYSVELGLETDIANISLFSDTLYSISNLIFDSLSNYTAAPNNQYFFYAFDSNSIDHYIFFSFNDFYDTSNSCGTYTNSLLASAQGYPVTDSLACDGTAYVTVYGGIPPYTYQFSSGSTDATAANLCPASYIVTVTDADSSIFSTTFIIGYPGTMCFSDPGSYNYIDTLYSNAAANCGLDYNMPVDSFFIDSSYAISNWAYVVNWVIMQDTNEYSFTETYFVDSTGDYLFGLSVYCEARSSAFGSFSFFSGSFADMSNGTTNVSGLKENNKISVYPNPSNGVYHLSSSSKMKEYTIFDQLGRKIIHKQLNSSDEIINITGFDSGMYYLIIQYQDGTTGKQKLLKK